MAVESTHSPTVSGDNHSSNNDIPYSNVTQFSSLMCFLCVTALVGSILQGVAPRYLLKAIPHPVIIMILYVFFGIMIRFAIPTWELDLAITFYVNPLMIQTLFLPVLLNSEVFRMNTRAFFIVFGQLLLLVGPGVVVCTLLTCLFPLFIMPSEPKFDFYLSMAFGAMLSTTDPVAIIICINELAAPKRLATIVGGESLLNDGASIILVEIFLELREAHDALHGVDASEMTLFIFNQLFFSVLFGIGMGFLTVLIIRIVRDDANTLVTLNIIMPFFTYVVSAYFMKSSGVLSIVPLGIIINEFGRGLMIEHVERIELLFDQLSFIATTWLYALSGFVAGEVIASSEIMAIDWASLFILYFWINLARFAMIFMSFPVMKHTGYGFSLREALLLSWGGLRGAVGLTLALAIKSNHLVSPRQGSLILFFMCGSILLMIFNGATAPILLKWLKLNSKPNPRLLEALYQRMSEKCAQALESTGTSRARARFLAYGTRSKLQLSRRQRRLSTVNGPEDDEEEELDLDKFMIIHPLTNCKVHEIVLSEQRRHLVLAQRHVFETLLSRELLNREGWYMLDRAADRQLEMNHVQMDQFKFVISRVKTRVRAASKLQRNFFKGRIGNLLLFLMDMGENPIETFFPDESEQQIVPVRQHGQEEVYNLDDPRMDHSTEGMSPVHISTNISQDDDDDDDDNKWIPIPEGIRKSASSNPNRTFGVTFTAEDWAFNFLTSSWAFLFAQQHSTHIVNEMFTVSPDLIAFEEERRALHEEISSNCELPASYINAVGKYAPQLMEKFKQMHALSEAKSKLFGAVAELKNHGVIERSDLKKLVKYAEKGLDRIQKHTFELCEPIQVGIRGELLSENPNFYPFQSHTKQQQQQEQKQASLSTSQRNHKFTLEETKELKSAVQRMKQQNNRMVVGGRKSLLRRETTTALQRRHSFSDFDSINHRLIGKLIFNDKEEEEKRVAWERQPLVDMSRMMETLKLDDTELRRF